MSATMTMTTTPEPPLAVSMTSTAPDSTITAKTCACPGCGLSLPPLGDTHAALLQAQKQIEDLEAQVQRLNEKAAAAVDRWADYEDELSRLRAASMSSNNTQANTASTLSYNRPSTPTANTSNNPTSGNGSPRASFLGAGASRISQLLSPRKSVSNLGTAAGAKSTPHLMPSSPEQPQKQNNTDELQAALTKEKKLRVAAETRVSDTSREVEELSASLFEQANKMVAEERKARAHLEERVNLLERRDNEKRYRLDRLESAVGRLESVRQLLDDAGPS